MQDTERAPSLEMIEVSKITPNENNPRGPNVRENDPHRENLKESIAEFGILVPLVLRRISDEKYDLVDGERRYWIAKSLKITKVPAYVETRKLDSKGILQRMFQIHMNRDQWDAVQQCKASEGVYAELLAKYPGSVDSVINELVRFSGDDRRTVRNRVQFLRWPSDIKDEIYREPAKHSSYWYVVEIEDKIIEPAQRNYPEYFRRVDVDDVRRFLYRKWESKIVSAGIEVRQAASIVRSEVKSKGEREKVVKILDKLVKQVDFNYEDAYNEFAQQFPDLVEPKLPKPRSLVNSVAYLSGVLTQYQPEHLLAYGKKDSGIGGEIIGVVEGLIRAAQGFLKRIKPLSR
jgi:ParB/RepB/Spo0J family partition protein